MTNYYYHDDYVPNVGYAIYLQPGRAWFTPPLPNPPHGLGGVMAGLWMMASMVTNYGLWRC